MKWAEKIEKYLIFIVYWVYLNFFLISAPIKIISGTTKVKKINKILERLFSKKSNVESCFNPNAIPNEVSKQGNIRGLLSDRFVIFFKISNIKYKFIFKAEISPNTHKKMNAASILWKKVPNSIYLTEI